MLPQDEADTLLVKSSQQQSRPEQQTHVFPTALYLSSCPPDALEQFGGNITSLESLELQPLCNHTTHSQMELLHAQQHMHQWAHSSETSWKIAVTTPALSRFVLIKQRGTHDFRNYHAVLLENAIMHDISAVWFQMH